MGKYFIISSKDYKNQKKKVKNIYYPIVKAKRKNLD
jgi:hypothetical protein